MAQAIGKQSGESLADEDDEQEDAGENAREFARLVGQGEADLQHGKHDDAEQRAMHGARAAKDRRARRGSHTSRGANRQTGQCRP